MKFIYGVALAMLLSLGMVHAKANSIVLNESNPALGSMVTFTSSFDVPKKYQDVVSIEILCSQSGALVFATAGYRDRSFLLGGSVSAWLTNGGPASCNAILYYWTANLHRVDLASTSFEAAGL